MNLLPPTKSSINNSFDQAAPTYHQVASIQQQSAQDLARFISENIPSNDLPSWLDLGCGTGFLSQSLLKYAPHAKITLNDLAPSMLQEAKKILKNSSLNSEIQILPGDLETLNPQQTWDLIASNFVWQWLENPQKTIQNWLPQTNFLALSIPLQGSLHEWETLHQKLNLTSSLYPLPTLAQIQQWIAPLTLSTVQITEKKYHQTFNNPLDFAHHLKQMGAAPKTQKPSSSTLQKICKQFPDALTISWQVVFIFIKK